MELQFIIGILFVAIIVLLQIISFIKTWDEIEQLRTYFPDKKSITIQYHSIKRDIINDDTKLDKLLSRKLPGLLDDAIILERGDSPSDYTKIPLISCSDSKHMDFLNTTHELNSYLCKNNDVAGADFGIIKEIYESHLTSMKSSVQNNLNTPLLLGLAGTFIGIIIGVWGVDVKEFMENGEINSVANLLHGVVSAMVASLLGLTLTIINTTIKYKQASNVCEFDKENYFNLLRKQLLPSLSSTMEQGLTSLKGVLGQFVGSFGDQLKGYTTAFQILNDNIEQEHELLKEINQLNITKTSLSIAKSFNKLKEASDELVVFHKYQQSLNNTVDNVTLSLAKFDDLINKFDDFFNALQMVVNNQNVASTMQRQFTDAIEQHFPLGSEGRERWHNEYDMLVADAQKTSEALQAELQATSQYIANFVETNKHTFNILGELPIMIDSLNKYAELQTICYNDLKQTIGSLTSQQKQNQIETADMNRSILEALEIITKTLNQHK